MPHTNNSTVLDIFEYQLIREGIIELININKITEGNAIDLLDKVRSLYDSQQGTALEVARAAVTDYLKGFNINDAEQVRHMAQLKIKVKQLEEIEEGN